MYAIRSYYASSADNGVEAFRIDGATGEVTLLDINPGMSSSSPQEFYEFNGDLYFSAFTPETDREFRITSYNVCYTKLLRH